MAPKQAPMVIRPSLERMSRRISSGCVNATEPRIDIGFSRVYEQRSVSSKLKCKIRHCDRALVPSVPVTECFPGASIVDGDDEQTGV